MSKTQAQRAKEYRQRKRDAVTEKCDEKRDVTECDASVTNVTKDECFDLSPHPSEIDDMIDTDMESAIGPLDIYSPARWSFLQGRGHEWDQDKQRGIRQDARQPNGCVVGVTVPGDPAYSRASGWDMSKSEPRNDYAEVV